MSQGRELGVLIRRGASEHTRFASLAHRGYAALPPTIYAGPRID